MRDLNKFNRDYATFLPAISGFFTEVMGRIKNYDGYLEPDRIPAGFENGFDGLNFLDPELGYFFYNKGLYSAGHAYLDIERSHVLEWMIQDRDRTQTTLVGDSGGFQIGRGIIKFDWEHFFEKESDPGYKGDADKVRAKILNWLEYTAEWSMILDVPPWAAFDKAGRERTGLTSFEQTLEATCFNNDYFVKHRQGKTKFLNVLQGTTWENSTLWYDTVKDYPFEGWAFGSNTARDIEFMLRRLIVMRDEGYLEGKDWIHVLGSSRLDLVVMLTAIQRQLRKHINPDVTVSFDCASPFVATANGRVYSQDFMQNKLMSYKMDFSFDSKDLAHNPDNNNGDMPFPFNSEIGERLTAGDVCRYKPGDLNKIGKESKTSWDAITYAIVMAHNVYRHVRVVQRANQLTDIESVSYKPDWKTWTPTQKRGGGQQFSKWVPRNLFYFNTFIEELFVSDNPMQMLDDASPLLQELNHSKWNDGNSEIFQTLFEDPNAEDDNTDEEQLDILEQELRAEKTN